MTSHYVNTARVTSAGVSVMHFMSRPQQPSFAYASDGAGPAHQNMSQVGVTKAVGP